MRKSKLLSVTAMVILAVFLIYQLYATFYNPISTEIVRQHTTIDGININGVIIRQEEFVKSNAAGAMHFEIEDGERVSAAGTIASVYANESQSIAATEMDLVATEIANIEEIQKNKDSSAVELGHINSKMYESLNKIISGANTGRFTDLTAYQENMLTLINRKQIATGQAVDFSSQIATLTARYNTLKAQKGTPIGTISAQKAGYFFSSTDGYETVLTPEKITELTPEFLDSLTPKNNTDTTVIGKLVSDYTWYIAATISISESLQFKEGDRLTVKTELKSNPEISVAVHKVNVSASDDRAVVVLSCQEVSGELSSMRSGAMTIVKKTYTGLKVSNKALRVVNTTVTDESGDTKTVNQTGVYTVTGMTAKFIPVSIIYSGGDYSLCEIKADDGNLRLYDEIIVKGKNIYDGKIID